MLKQFFLAATVLCSATFATAYSNKLTDKELDAARMEFYESVQKNSAAAAKRKIISIDGNGIDHKPQEYHDYLLASSTAPIIEYNPQPPAPFEIGDTRIFYLRNVITDSEGYLLQKQIMGKLIAQSEHSNVWILDDSDYHEKTETVHSSICHLNDITEALLQDFTGSFDLIYKAMTDPVTGFAPHAGVIINSSVQIGDIGEDGKVNFLLYDVYGDGRALNPGTISSFTAGFFSSADFSASGYGNSLDMLHIDIGEGQGFESLKAAAGSEEQLKFFGTLAHEFQHLLFHMYYGVYAPTNYTSYDWFNESLAELAAAFYVNPGTEIVNSSRMLYAGQNSYDGYGGYRDFLNRADGRKSYGMERLFAHAIYKAFPDWPVKIYEYMKTNFPPAKSLAEKTANGNKISPETIGDMFYAATGLGTGGGLNSLSIVYFLFMESFAADGGTIRETNGNTYPTMKFYNSTERDNNLWYCRKRFEPVILLPGGKAELKGYFRGYSGTPEWGATHDMLYKLGGGGINAPVLTIKIPEDEANTRYYIAFPNASGANTEAYLLEKGVENHINTEGRDTYLLGVTFYQDTEAVVEYSWSLGTAIARSKFAQENFGLHQYGKTLMVTMPSDKQSLHPQIALFNIAGKRQNINPVFSQDGTASISLANFRPGLYIVSVNGNKAKQIFLYSAL